MERFAINYERDILIDFSLDWWKISSAIAGGYRLKLCARCV